MTADALAATLILAPLLATLAAFGLPRLAAPAGLLGVGVVALASAALAWQLLATGPLTVTLGGWGAPLGVDLRADGLAALMLLMTAGVGLLVSLSALGATGLGPTPGEGAERARRRAFFWPLWMLLLAGLNALYLSGDVFNLYVTLEIVGLAAVGLTALTGTPAALRGAFGYLLASLLGSLLFLLGVDYLYAAHGRVDLAGLAAAQAAQPSPAASAALALMLSGLALKTALFPLHFWLPAAHANALAPASALLSALVVKGSLYLAIRLWLGVFGAEGAMGTLLGALGAGAVLWGSVEALRAERLKLLVAYSTVAQIGFVVLAFGVAGGAGTEAAWTGAIYLMLAHAAAKAAMFLAAGRIAEAAGHDRIAGLDRDAVRPGLAQVAFALAAVSLIGLPPSGGFVGKWLLMEGALRSGGWAWLAVVLAGTLLSAAYMARVVARFLRFDRVRAPLGDAPGPSLLDAPPLALAVASLALGLVAAGPLALLAVGDPLGLEALP